MDNSKQPGIQIHQVILLRAQFAHREDALSLPHTTMIGDLPLELEAKAFGNPGDAIAAVRLRAFTPHDRPDLLYSFDVEIAAVVTSIPGEENLDPVEYARNMGAAAFMPFLREAVANITMKGRFGPIWLKPVNLIAAQLQSLSPGR